MLGLKTAFGEVHYYLLSEVVKYHHVQEEVQNLLKFYTRTLTLQLSMATLPCPPFLLTWCPYKGIFEALSSSILVVTYLSSLLEENYLQLSFSPVYEYDKMFAPVHWCQFADDAAVITTDERKNLAAVELL